MRLKNSPFPNNEIALSIISMAAKPIPVYFKTLYHRFFLQG
jgi:hypothetical protein